MLNDMINRRGSLIAYSYLFFPRLLPNFSTIDYKGPQPAAKNKRSKQYYTGHSRIS